VRDSTGAYAPDECSGWKPGDRTAITIREPQRQRTSDATSHRTRCARRAVSDRRRELRETESPRLRQTSPSNPPTKVRRRFRHSCLTTCARLAPIDRRMPFPSRGHSRGSERRLTRLTAPMSKKKKQPAASAKGLDESSGRVRMQWLTSDRKAGLGHHLRFRIGLLDSGVVGVDLRLRLGHRSRPVLSARSYACRRRRMALLRRTFLQTWILSAERDALPRTGIGKSEGNTPTIFSRMVFTRIPGEDVWSELRRCRSSVGHDGLRRLCLSRFQLRLR